MQEATVGVALRGHPRPDSTQGWPQRATPTNVSASAKIFVGLVVLCVIAAAAFASWLPLQVSIVTLFLFAGPHNWFELIGRIGSARFWEVRTVPVARHPNGFPRIIAGVLIVAVVAAGVLWFGFSIDYPTTRDVYFTVAIAHVLAEAPFLLRML